ncbi:helix-turn-helix domain-containing protein [Haploplasma modicum]|uniref:helix-turn-helix domain-containing protein n=1 Tax=Haploplasma modicum TaxID=2150 RepID=UPI00047886F3|nr:helix-turn-helix domain-containing protein [Haploplasma modicum]
MKYLYIKSLENIEDQIPVFIEVFSTSLNIIKYTESSNVLIIYYESSFNEISDIVNILIADLSQNLLVYESIEYKNIEEVDKSIKLFSKIVETKYIPKKYINNHDLLKLSDGNIDENIKKLILNKYYKNQEIYYTIKMFLECNQNSSIAAKELFLHRNTLNQRLDKFYLETGFNMKHFSDAFLIYPIIK